MQEAPVFLRRPDVMRVTGLPVSTLYQMVKLGTFPKPVPLSPGRVGWVESEVLAWQQARIAERDGAKAKAA